VDIGVGQMRAIEFVAEASGDWALHCHKSHHTMNAMGHQVPTMIGVDQRDLVEKIGRLVPHYMVMGDKGMADMGEMQMPLPDNTLPMMSGTGQYGAIDMGGMFTTVKIREGLARNDYRDPGSYRHPKGTVAYAWNGDVPKAAEAESAKVDTNDIEVDVRKPTGHGSHH
jgi:hypothetical protein